MYKKLACRCHCINIDFLSVLDHFCDDDWMIWGNGTGREEFVLKLIVTVNDTHGRARKDVTRTDEDRVSDFFGEFFSIRDGCKFLPRGLIYSNSVEDLRKLMSILRLVTVCGDFSLDLEAKGGALKTSLTCHSDQFLKSLPYQFPAALEQCSEVIVHLQKRLHRWLVRAPTHP